MIRISGSNNILRNVTIADSPWDGVRMGDFENTGEGNNNLLDHVMIYHSMASGVYIHGSNSGGGNQNKVRNSLIGASSYATNICTIPIENSFGIYIDGHADYSEIAGNRIVCSVHDGIYIDGSAGQSMETMINFNYIGTDGPGIFLGNREDGIHDDHNIWTMIMWNVISGNGNNGIFLQGATEAELYANKVGISENGTAAIPNLWNGLALTDNASSNQIGDPVDPDLGNIFSGNDGCGVAVVSGAHDNVLDGNYIGLGTESAVVPNSLAGVCLDGAGATTLSTHPSSALQFISGNLREGVYSQNSDHLSINPATIIGLFPNNAAAVNGLEGVFLDVGTSQSVIWSHKIMYNGAAGIAATGAGSTNNDFFPDQISSNGGIPIDLGNDGPTDNGSQTPPGPNNWMQYPVVTLLEDWHLTGTACSYCSVHVYEAIGNPRDNLGGGIITSSVPASYGGGFTYDFDIRYPSITMVACDTSNNCSEMSPVVTNPAPIYKNYLPILKK